MNKIMICTVLAGLLVGMAVNAQRPSPQMQDAMRAKMQDKVRETDTDGDGAISHAEFMGQAETRFKTADLNADGKITPNEFEELRQKLMKQAMAARSAQGRR